MENKKGAQREGGSVNNGNADGQEATGARINTSDTSEGIDGNPAPEEDEKNDPQQDVGANRNAGNTDDKPDTLGNP